MLELTRCVTGEAPIDCEEFVCTYVHHVTHSLLTTAPAADQQRLNKALQDKVGWTALGQTKALARQIGYNKTRWTALAQSSVAPRHESMDVELELVTPSPSMSPLSGSHRVGQSPAMEVQDVRVIKPLPRGKVDVEVEAGFEVEVAPIPSEAGNTSKSAARERGWSLLDDGSPVPVVGAEKPKLQLESVTEGDATAVEAPSLKWLHECEADVEVEGTPGSGINVGSLSHDLQEEKSRDAAKADKASFPKLPKLQEGDDNMMCTGECRPSADADDVEVEVEGHVVAEADESETQFAMRSVGCSTVHVVPLPDNGQDKALLGRQLTTPVDHKVSSVQCSMVRVEGNGEATFRVTVVGRNSMRINNTQLKSGESAELLVGDTMGLDWRQPNKHVFEVVEVSAVDSAAGVGSVELSQAGVQGEGVAVDADLSGVRDRGWSLLDDSKDVRKMDISTLEAVNEEQTLTCLNQPRLPSIDVDVTLEVEVAVQPTLPTVDCEISFDVATGVSKALSIKNESDVAVVQPSMESQMFPSIDVEVEVDAHGAGESPKLPSVDCDLSFDASDVPKAPLMDDVISAAFDTLSPSSSQHIQVVREPKFPSVEVEVETKLPSMECQVACEVEAKAPKLPSVDVDMEVKAPKLPSVDFEMVNTPKLPSVEVEVEVKAPKLPSVDFEVEYDVEVKVPTLPSVECEVLLEWGPEPSSDESEPTLSSTDSKSHAQVIAPSNARERGWSLLDDSVPNLEEASITLELIVEEQFAADCESKQDVALKMPSMECEVELKVTKLPSMECELKVPKIPSLECEVEVECEVDAKVKAPEMPSIECEVEVECEVEDEMKAPKMPSMECEISWGDSDCDAEVKAPKAPKLPSVECNVDVDLPSTPQVSIPVFGTPSPSPLGSSEEAWLPGRQRKRRGSKDRGTNWRQNLNVEMQIATTPERLWFKQVKLEKTPDQRGFGLKCSTGDVSGKVYVEQIRQGSLADGKVAVGDQVTYSRFV